MAGLTPWMRPGSRHGNGEACTFCPRINRNGKHLNHCCNKHPEQDCPKIADYDANLKVVNNDPIVMSVSQEVVKESYLEAGRPDAYNPDNVFLVASEQFPMWQR